LPGILLSFLCILVIWIAFAGGVSLFAQSREAYQQAYRDWRASDPSLERDAAKAGDALTPRAEKAAAEAGKFVAARKAFYDAQRDDLAQSLKTLHPLELPKDIESAKTAEAALANQEASVATSIEVFANDPDKGIQQLRQALEREDEALTAVQTAISTRKTATDAVKQANEAAERARGIAAEQMKTISASFSESGQTIGPLAEAWPSYYRALASGARGVGAAEAMPGPVIRPADATPSTTLAPPTPVAPGGTGRVVTAVPISRYTGLWNFLPGVSTYHGMAPVSFEVLIKEEGGQISGSVNAQFIIFGSGDPNIRFNFSGPMQASRYQAFALKTPDGIQGKVELIPGNAFNLLEINYTLEGAPGKVRESDVILVKR
jgi:hypothetical protein